MSSPNFFLLYFLMISLAASSVTDPPDKDSQREDIQMYGRLTWYMYVLNNNVNFYSKKEKYIYKYNHAYIEEEHAWDNQWNEATKIHW